MIKLIKILIFSTKSELNEIFPPIIFAPWVYLPNLPVLRVAIPSPAVVNFIPTHANCFIVIARLSDFTNCLYYKIRNRSFINFYIILLFEFTRSFATAFIHRNQISNLHFMQIFKIYFSCIFFHFIFEIFPIIFIHKWFKPVYTMIDF